MMKRYLLASLILLSLSCKKNNNKQPVASADVTYMQAASYSNLAEVSAGTIATTNGNADSVKMFGEMMITDHGTAETGLQSLADSLSVTIPAAPDSFHQAKAAYLKTLTGYTFDTAYINAQVTDHMNTIASFNTEISTGTNTSVINFAKAHLPIIQGHLAEALTIQAQLK